MECMVLCFKAPEPGKVLAGMAPLLDPTKASKLYEAMIDDALDWSQELGVKRIVACEPSAQHPFFQSLTKRVYIEMADNPGQTRGQLINNAFSIGFKLGASKVLLWNGEAPTLTGKMFKEGYSRLEKATMVLGPGMNYRHYLLGAKKQPPTIFENVKWDTPREFADLIHACDASKISYHIHHFWHQLQRVDDVPFFSMYLNQINKTFPRQARHTKKILASLSLL